MKLRKNHWLVPLVLFVAVFVWALNAAYPNIGHDYFYFMPRLLAGRFHFAAQGIRPFLYTPHFCGGMPQYGNPQGMYYSLQQLFVLFADPWTAVQAAMIAYLLAGYAGWYLFGRDIMKMRGAWPHLLAIAVLANGYYALHMVVGHIASLTLPLIGLFLWILLERGKDTAGSLLFKSALFAAASAAALYSGGYLVILYAAMGFAAALPFEFAFCGQKFKDRMKALVPRTAACAAFAIAISASKLVAVWSFMRFFPRDIAFKTFPEGSQAFLFALRAMFEIPQRQMIFQLNEIGVHDYSAFVSPVVLIGLLAFLCPFIRAFCSPRAIHFLIPKKPVRAAAVALYTLILAIFFVQLIRGHGALVDFLQPLPIFRSLHVMTRFLYIPAVMLSVVGVKKLSAYFTSEKARSSRILPHVLSAVTVLAFLLAYYPILASGPDLLWRTVDYAGVKSMEEKHDGELAPLVAEVVDYRSVSGFMNVYEGLTNIQCTEPLFGTLFAGKHAEDGGIQARTTVETGPVDMVREGAFNLQNPSCFIYPSENGCKPWDRISTGDSKNFLRFIADEKVTWKMSALQKAANWLSLTALFGAVIAIAFKRKNNGL